MHFYSVIYNSDNLRPTFPKKLKLRGVAKNVAKFKSGFLAGLNYFTVLNSSPTERVDQIDRKTVNRQKTETCVVKNPKPSKSSKQGKPSDLKVDDFKCHFLSS